MKTSLGLRHVTLEPPQPTPDLPPKPRTLTSPHHSRYTPKLLKKTSQLHTLRKNSLKLPSRKPHSLQPPPNYQTHTKRTWWDSQGGGKGSGMKDKGSGIKGKGSGMKSKGSSIEGKKSGMEGKRSSLQGWQGDKGGMGKGQEQGQQQGRINSQPVPLGGVRQEVLQRVQRKVQFMRKLTVQGPLRVKGQVACDGGLFNFDRLYEHCLKKITRGIKSYEKDAGKQKDRRYYELKMEGSLLHSHLRSLRSSLLKQAPDQELGVIGNNLDLREHQPSQLQSSQREKANSLIYKKRVSRATKEAIKGNPFLLGELHGWEIRHNHPEEFDLHQ